MMATQLSKNDISAILNVLCVPRLQLQYRCEEFKTTLCQDVEWKPEYLGCWNGQPIDAFMPARMPFCLGMNVLEPRPAVWIDIPLKFKTVQGIVRFTIGDHVWYYDLPVTRAGMALYDALYKRFDGKVNLHLSLGGVVNVGDPTEEELEREWKIREEFGDLPRMEDIDWGKMGSTSDKIWDEVVKHTQTDGFKRAFGNHLEKIDGRIKVVED
jgi:hypothetical protein